MKKYLIPCLAIMLLVSCDLSTGNAKQIANKIDKHIYKEAKKGIKKYADNLTEKSRQRIQASKQQPKSLQNFNEDTLIIASIVNNRAEQLLTRTGYVTSYNADLRIPNWVGWVLTDAHTSGINKRKNSQFHEDYDVPTPRATHFDYIQSGYDRGHMCPAGDNKWDAQALDETFLMTNICPQNPNLNKGDWNELEMKCRNWANRMGKIYIVCGPILYNQKHKTIGKNRVTVPEAFFKVVLCLEGNPKGIGFIYKNQSGDKALNSYVNSIDQVERITGIDFFANLPDDIETEVEASYDLRQW